MLLELCSKILKFLCEEDNIFLEARYSVDVRDNKYPGIEACQIGMGKKCTWYGTPDARIRGSNLLYLRDATTSTVEAKTHFGATSLLQAISTCVVASFIEKKCHPTLPPVVPTILIDKKKFYVCLYDCESDVLLVSQRIDLTTDDHLPKTGLTVLWMIINYR